MRASSLALLAALLGACLLAAPAAAQAPGIGDRLLHTYFQFAPFPITVGTHPTLPFVSCGVRSKDPLPRCVLPSLIVPTEDAKDQGWSAEGGDASCDPDRGIAYANGGALSSSQPVRVRMHAVLCVCVLCVCLFVPPSVVAALFSLLLRSRE